MSNDEKKTSLNTQDGSSADWKEDSRPAIPEWPDPPELAGVPRMPDFHDPFSELPDSLRPAPPLSGYALPPKTPLKQIGLPWRIRMLLGRKGIDTAEKLSGMTSVEVREIFGIGSRELEVIAEKLQEAGLGFWGDPDPAAPPVQGMMEPPDFPEDSYPERDNTHPGKDKCDQLREIRRKIAKANNIEYEPAECFHTGSCAGTCPACDAEIRYLDEQLEQKRARGETINLTGLAAEDVSSAMEPCPEEEVLEGIARIPGDFPDEWDDFNE